MKERSPVVGSRTGHPPCSRRGRARSCGWQRLDHHHLRRGPRIIHADCHHYVEPVVASLADRVRFHFIHVLRIAADDQVAALAGGRAAHGRRKPVTRTGRIEVPLGVLVAGKGEAVAPALLIPGRLDQASAFHRLADAELTAIAALATFRRKIWQLASLFAWVREPC